MSFHADRVKTVFRWFLKNHVDYYIDNAVERIPPKALVETSPVNAWELAAKELPRILRELADKVESNQ